MTESPDHPYESPEVLLVAGGDDEALIRSLLAGVGADITACPGTHEAVARLAHKDFDAIVAVVGGTRQLEGLAKLRERAGDIPILALCARQDRSLCEAALGRGAREAMLLAGLRDDVFGYALRLMIERARREYEQRSQNAGLRAVFDLDAHPVWVCDPQTLRFLSANNAAVETYGYSEKEFAAMELADLLPRGAGSSELPPPGRTVIGRHRTRDGREIEVESFAQRTELGGREVVLLRVRDVTTERRAMRALEASERRFRDFFEHSTGFIFIHELDGTLLSVNPAAAASLGRSVAELLGTPLRDLAAPHLRFLIDQYLQRIARGGEDAGQVRVQHRDGTELVWQYRNRLYTDADGSAYVMGYAQDITAMRTVEQALQRSEQRLRTVADTLPVKIAYVDAQLHFVFANEAFCRAYPAGGDGIVGAHVRDVLGEARYARREPWLVRALAGERVVFEDEEGDGEEYQCVEITFIPETADKDGSVIGVHAMVQDITSKKREERRLIHLARIDPLTGLINRAGFYERLESAIERSREKEWLLSVFYLDIDRFKQVNDTHGHAVGDALIRAFATRLGENVRASDTVARLGGDEFIVVMEGIPDVKRVRTIATKLVMAMSRPFELRSENLTLTMGASLGVAACHACSLPAPRLVARADAMLYEAKQAGRGTYRLELVDAAAQGRTEEA
jgi:diguanylate cyclase (GGDEF)-like protein/PAS domain S-box-containing protein